MNSTARIYADFAVTAISEGRTNDAIRLLRKSLRYTYCRRSWSRLMWALRELQR